MKRGVTHENSVVDTPEVHLDSTALKTGVGTGYSVIKLPLAVSTPLDVDEATDIGRP